MKYTPEEVKQYVKEEDVKFVRMAFCDVYGRHIYRRILSGRHAIGRVLRRSAH